MKNAASNVPDDVPEGYAPHRRLWLSPPLSDFFVDALFSLPSHKRICGRDGRRQIAREITRSPRLIDISPGRVRSFFEASLLSIPPRCLRRARACVVLTDASRKMILFA